MKTSGRFHGLLLCGMLVAGSLAIVNAAPSTKADSAPMPIAANHDLIGTAISFPTPVTCIAGALLILPLLVSLVRVKT